MSDQLKPYEMMHRDPIGGTVVNSLWYRKEDADTALAAKDARIAELEAYICYADEVSTCAEQLLKMIQIDACDVTKDMVAVLRLDAALKELESFDNTCADCETAATPSEDGGEVGQLLVTALRQYQHNDCSGLLAGYDCAEAKRIVSDLIAQHSRIVAAKDAEIARLKAISDSYFSMAAERTEQIVARDKEIAQLRAQPARQVGGDREDMQTFIELFAERLLASGAANYLEDSFDLEFEATGKKCLVVIRLQHPDKPTPHQMRMEAEARAALAPAVVVMPLYDDPELHTPGSGNQAAAIGYNAALDEVARLNRRVIPYEFIKRIESLLDLRAEFDPTYRPETHPLNDDAKLLIELRALLGKY